MLTFAQFGAGRIGAVHAANLAESANTKLRYVVDVDLTAAEALARKYNATVVSAAAALDDPAIDAGPQRGKAGIEATIETHQHRHACLPHDRETFVHAFQR